MTEKRCPHCGKTISLEEEIFGIDPDTAVAELLLAQLSRIYRQSFEQGYPAAGEGDVQALGQLFIGYRDDAGRLTIEMITRIIDHWREYLDGVGAAGRISAFVYDWLPERVPGARIIPFRKRPAE